MKRKKAAAGTGLRATLIVLCTVLALMLTVMLGATIYAEHLLAQMNYVDPNHPRETLSPEEIHAIEHAGNDGNSDFTGPSIDEDDVDWGDQVGTNIGGKDDSNIINILLIGQDRRPGEGTARSDSMILCTFNKSRKTLTMTSFLRDLYLQIPGYKDNRINAAYALGGMSLLNATLEQNFGIHVDGNIEVDFNQFSRIIDLMGGVSMDLTSSEANYINQWVVGSTLTQGVHILNGEQALMHARNRNDIDGDFSRSNRQRALLTEVVKTYRETSLTTMLSLMYEILPMITTDMDKSEITGYITELLPILVDSDIVTQRIPVDGGFYSASIRGMSVLVPYMDVNRQALADSLAGSSVD